MMLPVLSVSAAKIRPAKNAYRILYISGLLITGLTGDPAVPAKCASAKSAELRSICVEAASFERTPIRHFLKTNSSIRAAHRTSPKDLKICCLLTK